LQTRVQIYTTLFRMLQGCEKIVFTMLRTTFSANKPIL